MGSHGHEWAAPQAAARFLARFLELVKTVHQLAEVDIGLPDADRYVR